MTLRFSDIEAEVPTLQQVESEYQEFHRQFDAATDRAQRREVVDRWDQLIRCLDTWSSLTHLHFEQDTGNPEYKRDLEYRDELNPKLIELSVAFKRKLLAPKHRAEVESELGHQALAIWEADVSTYEPAIEQQMVEEAGICSQYTALLASAELELRGEKLNLSEVEKFQEHPDRELRYEAEQARWRWYSDKRELLDELFENLVHLRHAMADKLSFPSFVELGYQRMVRVDYGRSDVESFRESVRERVVPLCSRLVSRQKELLGLGEKVMHWDEPLLDPSGNPQPQGGHDWMIEQATSMFDEMCDPLGDFFRRMADGKFMDLKSRPQKAGGGFCTSFSSTGMPFIFANFNGSKGDVEVFTHEIGHAFQNYLSRSQPLFDYTWPTYESCEIHSMGLEFLTWPYMELFFGEAAAHFRHIHLEQSLRFLPYGVAVDHFQHLVYQSPTATTEQRHEMWREMERMYLPWRDYGDLPHVAEGGFWQKQRHIYLSPFYYIDYTLALTCAMQLWVRSQKDYSATLQEYVALCRRGGEAPFQELATSANLRSPFAPGCLDEVVAAAERELAL